MSTLYETISKLCRERGITGAKLCADINVSKSLMTSLKTGRTSTINSATAQKIAAYFEVPVGYILGEDIVLRDVVYMTAKDNGLDKAVELLDKTKKPADQKASGLRGLGYDELTPENKAVIDALIDTLLKSQSGER